MKPRRIFSAARLSLPFASALVAMFAAQSLQAATLTWDNGAATGSWNTTDLNWTGSAWTNVPPDDAIFGAAGVGTVTLGTAITAGSLTFNTAGYTINTATSGLTLNTGITATESATIQNGVGGSIILGAANTWSVADTKTLTVSSPISGGFGIAKTGLGTLVLSGANSFTGATTITTGAVNIQHATALGTTAGGVTVANGGALQIQGGITVGAEAITINGGGVASPANLGAIRNISGNNTWGGTVTLASQSRINSDAGTLTLSAANSVTAANFTLVVGGAGNTTISGIVALGSGGVSKDGAGTLTLSGANTYTGGTTLGAGTLVTGNTAALGAAGQALNLNGGTLRLATNTALSSKNVTLGGNTAITLDRATSGAGFTTTFGNLTSTTGNRTLTLSKGANVTDAATLDFTGTLSVNNRTTTFDVGSGATLRLSGASASGAQTISMIKNGTGSLILAGNYGTWDGGAATLLNAGTLELRSIMGDTGTFRNLTAGASTTLRLVNDASFNFRSNLTANGSMGIVADRLTSATTSTTHTLGTLSIGASTLSVSRGASITGAGVGGVTFGNATLTGAATFTTNANTLLTLGGTTALGTANNALTKSGAGSMTLTGVVSGGNTTAGNNALNVTAGTLTLGSTANTFVGDVVINGSTAVVSITGTAGGTFGASSPLGAQASVYKQVELSNGGTFRLSSGNYNVNVPTATNVGAGQVFNIGTGGGIFDVLGTSILTLDDGSGAAGTAWTSPQLRGAGTLTKTGNGTLSLGAGTSNFGTAFTGAITVSAGTLQLGNAGNPLGNTTNGTTIQSGARLNVNGTTQTVAEPLTISGTGLASAPAGALTNASGTAATWAGPVTLGGAATIGTSAAGALTLSSNATVNLGSNTLTLRTGSGRIFTDGVISGTGSVVMDSSGTGDYVPRADHTYSGGTTLTAGLIAVDRDSIGTPGSLTSGPFGTGTLTIAGGQMRSSSTVGRSFGNAVTLSGDATFYTVASEKSLTFTGPVTLSGGNRTLTGNVGTTVAGTSTIFSGAIGDGGNNLGLTKAGAGNLTLGGANTYTGVTGSTGGNLLVTGSLANNSGLSIAPTAASGAVISFVNNAANTPANFGSLALGSATGTSFIGLDLGTASDSIVTSAAATASNNIGFHLNAASGFGAGNYSLISAASGLTTGGATYSLGSVPGGYTYALNSTDTLVELTATAATAGNRYWRGNLSNSWAAFSGVSTTNWSTDAAGTIVSASTPGAGDTVFFSATAATGPAITTTVDNDFTINDLQFLSAPTGVASVTINPGVNPGTSGLGSLTLTPTSSATGLTLAQGTGAVTIAAPITLGAAQTWSVDSSTPGSGTDSSLTVSGAITGLAANGLTFTTTAGTAPIILSSVGSTYSGGSTISANTIVQGGAANAFSPNTAWTVEGTLNTGAFSQATGSLAGGSGIVQNGSGTNAILTIGSDNLASATFAGTIQNGSTGTLGLTKAGTGTQILSGTNTYTGTTTVSNGTLRLGSALTGTAIAVSGGTLQTAGFLPAASAVTMTGTGTLDLFGASQTIASATSVATNIITNSSTGTGASTATVAGTPSGTGVYVDSLVFSQARTTGLAALITDGATRQTQIVINNNNTNDSILNNTANSFSGGLVLAHNTVNGTRLSVGTISGTRWGTGPIIIGQAATDKAGIYFANAGQNLVNPIVFNTGLGNDRFGIRSDVAGSTLSGQITANSDAVFSSNAIGSALILANKITGAGGLVLDLSQTSTANTALNVTLNNASANNDYQGDTIIGRTNVAPAQNYAATLSLGAANQIPNGPGTGNVILNNASISRTGTLNLAGFSETINGLSGNGTVDGTSGTPTLTVGDNNATATFSGVIQNTAGTLSLTKTGTGTQALSGANTYSGVTNVTAGTLAFSAANNLGDGSATNTITLNGGTLSYTGSTGINLAANQVMTIGSGGGTLNASETGGTLNLPGGITTSTAANLTKTGLGTVTVTGSTDLNGGNVTVSGGVLNAGFTATGLGAINVANAGTLNLYDGAVTTMGISGLTLAAGSSLGFDLNAPTVNDILSLTGTASVTAGVSLNFNNLGGLAAGTYDLINVSAGTLTATDYALGLAPSGFNYTFSTINSDQTLRLTASPLSLRYWTGDQDGNWNTDNTGNTNWASDAAGTTDPGALPGATDTLVFSATNAVGPAIATSLNNVAVTADSLRFISAPTVPATTAVTVASGGAGGILTINPFGSNNGITVAGSGGDVTISAPIVAQSNQTWEVDGGSPSSLTVDGNVTFTGSVTKTGAGALTLSGTNSGSGDFNLIAGTLNLNSAGALGTGDFNIATGTTLDNSSAGAVTLSANGAVNLNGDFTFTGTQSLNLGTGAVNLSGNPIANVTANTLTLGGVVGGTSNLTKAGAGTLVLGENNTYTGVTTISGGVLRITEDSGLGTTGNGTFQSGTSALELDGTGGAIAVGNEALTINGGGITNLGALRNIAGNNTYGGTVTLAAQSRINSDSGTLTLNNATAVSASNLTLVVGGAGDTTISGAIATGTGGLIKDGTGILTLSGTNTYTGNTTVNGGTLNITGSISGLAASTNLAYGGTAGNTIVNISGSGSISNYRNFQGANVAGSIAVMNQTGGSTSTLGTNGQDTQWVAQNGGYGYLNITGGTFNTGRFDAVGATGGGTAVVYVGGGGTFNNNSGDWLILPRKEGVGQLTVGPGGSLVRTADVTASLGITMDASNAHGALNIAGGTVDTGVRPLNFGFGSGAFTNTRGFVNLAGGTLSVGAAIVQTNTNAGGQYFEHFNFVGGTLKSNAAMTWLPAASAAGHTITATIYGAVTNNNNANAAFNTQIGTTSNFTGGLTVDTNGFATTIAQGLRGADGVGVTQADIGDLSALSGNSGYIGAPSVVFSAPTSPTGVPASGYAVIDTVTGKVNGIVITNPGTYAANETPSITLTGGGGSIAAFNTAALNTANVSGGLTKIGSDTLALSGANTYTGTTLISAGTLQLGAAGTTGSLSPSSAIINDSVFAVNRTNTATQGADFGTFTGTGSFTQAGSGTTIFTESNTYTTTSITAGTLQIGNGGTTGALGSGAISNAGTLAFNRTDTYTLGAANLVTGTGGVTLAGSGAVATAVDNQFNVSGILTFGATNGSTTVSALDLTNGSSTFGGLLVQTNSTTANAITLPAAKSLTVNGGMTLGNNVDGGEARLTMSGGGALVVNGTSIIVGNNTTGTNNSSEAHLDLSGLGSFTATLSGNLTVQNQGDNSGSDSSSLTLSNVANSITAAAVRIGNSSTGAPQTLWLGGGTNLIQTDLINLGAGTRDSGIIDFAGSGGSVTLRNAAGTGRIANVNLGPQSAQGTAYTTASLIDLTGNTADVAIGTFATSLGAKAADNTNDLLFDSGTLDILSINMAFAKGTGASTNRITIGGGTVRLGGSAAFSDAGTGVLTLATAGSGELIINGGTVTSTSSLLKGAGTGTATVTLAGGTLDMTGQNIGSATNGVVLAALSGTLQNVAAINGTGGLTKTSVGTLTLAGANTYTGATAVSEGKLLVNGSTVAASAFTVAGGATLGGTGTIEGTVNVTGVLSPGATVESLKTGALTMVSGSTYFYEATDNTPTGADLLGVSGALSLTDVTLDLTNAALNSGGWNPGDKLTLMSYIDAGSGITSGFTNGTNPYLDGNDYTFGSNVWTFDYNDTTAGNNYTADLTGTAGLDAKYVTFTLVPEPSSVALLGVLGSMLLLRRRR